MKRIALITSLAALLLSTAAFAHSHLQKSDPANGSVLTTAPTQFTLEFSEPVRVTVLAIQKGDAKGEPISGAPKDAAAKISVPAPKLTSGSYVVTWRVVSGDNHIANGKFQFTIQ